MIREIVLDRELMIAVVTDAAFYTACPAFADLEVEAYRLEKLARTTRGCCGARARVMLPVIDPFITRLHAARTADPALVAAVRRFILAKKRYADLPIRVYYRSSRDKPATRFRL